MENKDFDNDLDKYYEVALELTKEGGKLIKDGASKAKKVETKSSRTDLLTETDKAVEDLLILKISSIFPGHKFIGEETVSAGGKCELTDDPTWIIDPVDGTMNFVHNFPYFCLSLALWINKKAEIGIVYNPILEKMFTARRGKGAFLNGEKIEVSGQTDISQALILTEMGTRNNEEKMKVVYSNLKTLMQHAHGVRWQGSAALDICSVGIGYCDAFYHIGLHCWDMAAGDLIVREAGGVVIDITGEPLDVLNRRVLCASSKEIADKMVSLLEIYNEERD